MKMIKEKTMTKLPLFGTGVMGGPMAAHLQKAGHDDDV